MNIKPGIHLYLLSLIILVSACAEKQPEDPNPVRRKSPIAIANVKHGSTYTKITYGQPYRNNRTIFGELVPYGKVWRTGANEATELTTTEPIRVKGKKLEAGTYSLFTIPGRETWVIIFNSGVGQWGAFEYMPQNDILRVEVPSNTKKQLTEVFTIQFSEVQKESTEMIMRWENTEVKIPVEFIVNSSQPS